MKSNKKKLTKFGSEPEISLAIRQKKEKWQEKTIVLTNW